MQLGERRSCATRQPSVLPHRSHAGPSREEKPTPFARRKVYPIDIRAPRQRDGRLREDGPDGVDLARERTGFSPYAASAERVAAGRRHGSRRDAGAPSAPFRFVAIGALRRRLTVCFVARSMTNAKNARKAVKRPLLRCFDSRPRSRHHHQPFSSTRGRTRSSTASKRNAIGTAARTTGTMRKRLP